MKESRPPIDLSTLAADYEIVGELDGGGESRRYMGRRKGEASKRRDDQREVMIEIVTTPAGDEANALTHLAADTGLLTRQVHRRLVPVLEGRWIGNDAFAVVTQRIADPSLAHLLVTGETFTNPRIAAILREVNGLLEWARGQHVVHRSITADRIFLEPKTDRVRVAFGVSPIRRLQHSDADDDARTIARLAMAMLTGEADPQAYAGKSLAELRSDLPERLGEATTTLLDTGRTSTPADVAAYLALIGMADPLRAGETERDRVRAEVLEEQRVEREKLAGERADFERETADARAAFEQEMADARDKLEAHRVALENAVSRERAELERVVNAERDELQRALASERTVLVATRMELERTVKEQRAELERVAAEDRRRMDELRAELRRAGEVEIERKRDTALEDITDAEDSLDQGDLATPLFVAPVLASIQPIEFDDDTPVMRTEPIAFTPPPPLPVAPELIEPWEAEPVALASNDGPSRRTWIMAGVGAALVAAVLVWGIALSKGPAARPVVAAAPRPVPAPVAAAPVVSAPAPAALPVADSATRVASSRWLDSLKGAYPLVYTERSTGSSAARLASPVIRATPSSVEASPEPRRVVRDTTERRQPARTLTDSLFFIPGSATPVRPPRS